MKKPLKPGFRVLHWRVGLELRVVRFLVPFLIIGGHFRHISVKFNEDTIEESKSSEKIKNYISVNK